MLSSSLLRFSSNLGWRPDAVVVVGDAFRGLHFTPPGSSCSIYFVISEGGKLCEFKHRRIFTLKGAPMKTTRVTAVLVLIVGSGSALSVAQA
jgi:hypothetical protein